MSTEVMLRSNATLDDKVEYCRLLAESGLLPANYRKQPANVLYAVEYGEMIGVPAMAAINGVHIIKGKPTASASLISALVRRAGHKLRVGFDSAKQMGWAEIIRADDPDFTYRSEWDLDRAVTAELCVMRDGKPYAVDKDGDSLPWKKFFPSMTKARAITEVARDACEEVLFGLHYTPDELGAEVDEDGAPIEVTVEQAVEKMRRNQPQRPADDEWSTPQDAPAQTPDASTEAPTDAMLQRIAMLMTDKFGISNRDSRLAKLSELLGFELTSSRGLSAAQARALRDQLNALPDHVADAEIVPDGPMTSEPNPRNGDGPMLDSALFVPPLGVLINRAQEPDGPDVPTQLLTLVAEASTPSVVTRVGKLAVEARKDGHLTEDQFAALAQAANKRRVELERSASVAPNAEQSGAADRFAQRITQVADLEALTDLHGTLTESRDAGNVTAEQFEALQSLMDDRYAELAKPEAAEPEAEPSWAARKMRQMEAAGAR